MNPGNTTETGSDHLQSGREDPVMPKLTTFMIIGNRKRGAAVEVRPAAAERVALVSWGQLRRDPEASSGPFRVR